jgi:hypothetical protein
LKFLQEPYKPKTPKKKYLVGDQVFIPTLDVSKITTAQYVDFQTLIKRGEHKPLLNIFFIKDGEEYGQSDNSDYLWENLSLPDYADVQFFFLHLLNRLMTDTLNSSKKILKKLYRMEKDQEKKKEIMDKMIVIQTTLSELSENEFLE